MACIGFNAGIGEHMSALKNPETQLVVVIKVHIFVLAALRSLPTLLRSVCLH